MAHIFYILTHITEVLIPAFHWLGPWSYVILFVLIFMETGLVVFPWLPGESLIFLSSSFAAIDSSDLKLSILIPTFFCAAVLGDFVNYEIGRRLGRWPWLMNKIRGPKFNSAQQFFDSHGMLAVIFGRFVPLIRTFVPLISGASGFALSHFTIANVIGVALWVGIGSIVGYFFGQIPFVRQHFSLIILALVIVVIITLILLAIIRHARRSIMRRNNMLK